LWSFPLERFFLAANWYSSLANAAGCITMLEKK
jgi:hypothetical protein